MSRVSDSPGYQDGWCIHYRSPSQGLGKPELETCEAGVRFDRWHGTKFGSRPCFLDKGVPKPDALPCECLRIPTPEEIAAHDKWANARMEVFTKVMVAIGPWRKAHKGHSCAEIIECPACKGRLHLSIAAYNGHVHGHCETKGCVSWME